MSLPALFTHSYDPCLTHKPVNWHTCPSASRCLIYTGYPKSHFTLLVNSSKLHKKHVIYISSIKKKSLQFHLQNLPSCSYSLKTYCDPSQQYLSSCVSFRNFQSVYIVTFGTPCISHTYICVPNEYFSVLQNNYLSQA